MGTPLEPMTPHGRNSDSASGHKLPSVNFYLVCLVLACLTPGIIGSFSQVVRHNEQQRSALETSSIQNARSLMQTVDTEVIRRQSVLEGLVTSDAAHQRDFRALHRRMQQILEKPSFESRFSITDKDGQLIANTTLPYGRVLPKNGNLPHIEAVIKSKQPLISGVFIGSIYHDPLVTVSVPVILEGEVDYVLSASINPDVFTHLLKNQGVPFNWRAAVLDQQGQFIARIRGNNQNSGIQRNDKLWNGMQATPEGAFETTTSDGERILAAYSRSTVTGWTVILGVPLDPLEAEYKKPFYVLLASIGVLFGLVVALAWWMSDRIAHSVQALLLPAQHLGQGKPVELPAVHINEAAGVARALVDASDVLRERTEALDAEKNSRLKQLEQMVAERTEALEAAMKASEALARRDALTGLLNRLAANERLQEEFLRMKRTGQVYSVLLMDIDHFKQVNDTYGHETGDQVLKTVADVLENNVRSTDLVFRYGGEEFLILLPVTGHEGAQVIAEKIRSAVEANLFGSWLQITISVGISSALLDDANDQEVTRRADSALYMAKNGGRNQTQHC